MVSKLCVMKQTDPPVPKPWRIMEVYDSCDGPRTRIANGAWASEEEVLTQIDLHKAGRHKNEE